MGLPNVMYNTKILTTILSVSGHVCQMVIRTTLVRHTEVQRLLDGPTGEAQTITGRHVFARVFNIVKKRTQTGKRVVEVEMISMDGKNIHLDIYDTAAYGGDDLASPTNLVSSYP
jgi:hypothetical protein